MISFVLCDARFCEEFLKILLFFPGPDFVPFQGHLPKEVPGSRDMTPADLFPLFAAILSREPCIDDHDPLCREIDLEPIFSQRDFPRITFPKNFLGGSDGYAWVIGSFSETHLSQPPFRMATL